MKKLTDIICIFTSAALLLAGCNNNSGEEIDLSPIPIETDNDRLTLDSLRKSEMTPFIMPQYGTEEYDYYSSLLTWGDPCIPGRLYLQCMVNRNESAILLLTNIAFREEMGIYSYQPWDRKMIYAVAAGENGDRLMKVDQETGKATLLYYAKAEAIRFMMELDDCYIYFSSGSRILYLNIYTDEVMTLAECEGEVSDLAYTHDSIAWADGNGNYFLYDREKEEGVPVDYDELFPFYEQYYYTFRDGGDGISTLYLVTDKTGEEELIADNITVVLYATVSLMYAQVGNDRIISVNGTEGGIETVYRARTEDMELINIDVRTDENSGESYAKRLFVREEREIVQVDLETFEAETLFTLENGLADANYGEREFYSFDFAEHSLTMLSANENEYDLDKFYICEECDGDYCLWVDSDRNWFWYHPHSRENEEVEVIEVRLYAYITQRD